LINSHDHLRGDYLPRVGPKKGRYYLNWSYWDADLKASKVFEERSAISVEQMYQLGAWKNIFSGVATVNDHFPHEINDAYIAHLPLKVIREYTLAHECSSFDLKWGDGIEIEHRRAIEKDWPFITHLEEGFDAESQDGVPILKRLKCLDDHALLIHCIGFSDQDIADVKKAGASVSWCPASNFFMFNTTCKIKKMLQSGVNVAIGTDSTATGSVNLLEEMRFARKVYERMYGEKLDAKLMFEMVTINAAKAFRVADRKGSIAQGKCADLLILKRKKKDPYENLISARSEDIELLVVEGLPVFGESRFKALLPKRDGYSKIMVGGRECFAKGAPDKLYKQIRAEVGFQKKLDFLPFEP
jgi:hypothetical protein